MQGCSCVGSRFHSSEAFSGADEVSGDQWQLVTTHSWWRDDDLILCDWHSQDHACAHSSHVCFSLAGTNTQWASQCFVEFFSAISLRFQFTLALKISGLESYRLLLGSQEACDFMNVVTVSWIHDIHFGLLQAAMSWRDDAISQSSKNIGKTTDDQKSLFFFSLVLCRGYLLSAKGNVGFLCYQRNL